MAAREGRVLPIFMVALTITLFRHHFLRNQADVCGWGWGWGSGYGDNGYGNTTVVAFPQATPQAAGVTGSIPSWAVSLECGYIQRPVRGGR